MWLYPGQLHMHMEVLSCNFQVRFLTHNENRLPFSFPLPAGWNVDVIAGATTASLDREVETTH